MAKAPTQDNNGAAAKGETVTPTFSVMRQYVKDFSFENPNAPNSLRARETSPNINININVNANALAPTDYEVTLTLEAKAVAGTETVFNVELIYAGLFRIQGVPENALHPALLIECPRILFPFARQILADATQSGGFPPLMIDPVDFARLYQQRAQEAQAKTN